MEIKVLTPEITYLMNVDVKDGKTPPYAYYGFDSDDYLDFSVWLENVLSYIKKQNEIIKYYETSITEINKNISETNTQEGKK